MVFPAGSGSGAVDVSASFISSPTIYVSYQLGGQGCSIGPGSNASCPGSISSPSVIYYNLGIGDWGGSTPGPITMTDNCGGRFGTTDSQPHNRSGAWLPPVGAGVCILTATAVNGDGIVGTASAAILVRAGTPATSQPPSISGQLFPGPICILDTNVPSPVSCGAIPAGTQMSVYGSVSWADGIPGSVVLLDNCNGGLLQPTPRVQLQQPVELAWPARAELLPDRPRHEPPGQRERDHRAVSAAVMGLLRGRRSAAALR